MHEYRRFLRALLSARIAEREYAALLYIPRGEEGMRRMIRALLDMRPPRDNDPLEACIGRFLKGEYTAFFRPRRPSGAGGFLCFIACSAHPRSACRKAARGF